MSPKDVATFVASVTGIACTPKDVRAFVRASGVADRVGSGHRYAWSVTQAKAIAEAFAAHAMRKGGKAPERSADEIAALLG